MVSYQTAYLKAHYPSEFMAAVLSRNLSDIKKITLFMDECRRMGIQVLGPDVNESNYKFTVMPNGDVRFGLGAIKGVGEGAVANIIETRKAGKFVDVYDFVEKVNLQTVNKKNFESLVLAGAFDNLGITERAQFFSQDPKGSTFVEQLIRYGAKIQQEKNNTQQTLFGGMDSGFELQRPEMLTVEGWSKLETLGKEKELIGIYLSAHPLDDYKLEVDRFCNVTLSEMHDPTRLIGRELTFAGIVSEAKVLTTKKGNFYGRLTIEDFTDSYEITLFGKDFENNRKFFFVGYPLLIKGKFDHSRYRPGELEFFIKTMQMLSDVRDELVKKITISLTVDEINNEVINKIHALTTANTGKVMLRFRLMDPQSRVNLEMFSRAYRVNPSNEFVEHLRQMNLNFKIN
jgi:DNA polymerase-3 subunit alpha